MASSAAADAARFRMTTSTSEPRDGSDARAPGKGSGRVSRSSFLRLLGAGATVVTGRPAASVAAETPGSAFAFGVFTDCQYADIDTPAKSRRLYRRSPQKLADAVTHFNEMEDLAFLLHLGDAVDRDERSYRVVRPIFDASRVPVHHVAGNHDYEIAAHLKVRVPSLLGMPAPHYRIEHGDWRFLMLDGNALSYFAWPPGSAEYAAAATFCRGFPVPPATYNGGLGEAQREWLRAEIASAKAARRRCLVCCHYPVVGDPGHALWDAADVEPILEAGRDVVAAWFNGHNHAGGYRERHGIHFLNFKGMVEEATNAYARVEVRADRIEVIGHGREPSRTLRLARAPWAGTGGS